MKTYLSFNFHNPDDMYDYKVIQQAQAMFAALQDLDNELKRVTKYGDARGYLPTKIWEEVEDNEDNVKDFPNNVAISVLDKFRDKFIEILADNRVHLDF